MAEHVAPSTAKRARKPNFTPGECTVIFEEAEENINIIKSKFTSTVTNKNKTRVWDKITNKVNALGICKRGVIRVKVKWRAMVDFIHWIAIYLLDKTYLLFEQPGPEL